MKGRAVAYVPTPDPKRAARWYASKLGMTHVADAAFESVVRDAGLTIRLTQVEPFEPTPFTILGWEVRDLDATMRQLKAKRVRFVYYPNIGMPKDTRVWTSPAGARVAWLQDRDGNVLSLTQLPR